ncbi:MAG: hypothetical protein M3Z04_14000 [Chloroflexota bacterium]|nr:hypothetical protein [Chloroflexota bacterium]
MPPPIQIAWTPVEYARRAARAVAGQIAADGLATITPAQAGGGLLSTEQLAAIGALSKQPPAAFVAAALDTQIAGECALGREGES